MTPLARALPTRLPRAGWLLASALVLPLAVLLFAQWPLRDWIQAWSAQTNDMGQICFAVYAAVAVTAASRTHSHMAAHTPLEVGHHTRVNWRPRALLICVGPWALFMLWAAAPQVWDSVSTMERFTETLTPGYFIIKLALILMLVLVLLEALLAALQSLLQRRGGRTVPVAPAAHHDGS